MSVRVAETCMNWSQPVVVPAGAFTVSLHTANKRGMSNSSLNRALIHGFRLKPRFRFQVRACGASLDGFSDEEFHKQLQEVALKFGVSSRDKKNNYDAPSVVSSRPFSSEPSWVKFHPEPPDWPERNEIIPACVERKANNVDLPISLRIIKRKNQWQECLIDAGDSGYSSVKKAFSSMLLIIQELQIYTLKMRETILLEDQRRGVIDQVQKEMQESFVWLFQQVFSHTPTLMVYVMILLANFSVHSMVNNVAVIAPLPNCYRDSTETVVMTENTKFDSSKVMKTSVGGNNGGGGVGSSRPVASGADGGDRSSNFHGTIFADEISQMPSLGNSVSRQTGIESESGSEEEVKFWISISELASRMQGVVLDRETVSRFVSPIIANIEPDDHKDYIRTDLMYQLAVSKEPQNVLLLSNYAQFLYFVVHDHDRAEEFFGRAVKVAPSDAETISRYANFLWLARKDLGAAEQAYMDAIEVEPGNAYYAANYANFLWSTGADDTCYPLSTTAKEA
ncbi:hypothetical protein GIB67_036803 [Kingdonia uniflora]|uniref:Uncharacterized protein n=1 Tax=Kingdonia uniflora TaxID=39325 RepID=A0A7J7LWZ9_9MAGN|nr:hypothetical protein GIB67_036803 [Kingdonia uniflora]